MNITKNVELLKNDLKDYPNVTVVAATKYVDCEVTKEIINNGINCIGENRTDSLLEKYDVLGNENIEWHFFGVLQTRKVKSIIDKIDYLHSLDSLSLASEINKKATKEIKCFVQVNVSNDPKKAGLEEKKVCTFIKQLQRFEKIKVVGLMTINKLTYDDEELASYFAKMKKLQEKVQDLELEYAPCKLLSMGMSNDYKIALQYGATHIRIGRKLLEEN